jgi:hypothetical protein
MTMDRRGHLTPLSVREAFAGVRVERWSNLPRGASLEVDLEAGSLSGVVEDLAALDAQTEVLVNWRGGRSGAITRRRVRRGAVWSVGGAPDASLLKWVMHAAELKSALAAPASVEVIERDDGSVWLINHSAIPARVNGLPAGTLAGGGPVRDGQVELAGYQTAVVLRTGT